VLSPIVYRKTVGISALGQLVAVLFLGYHLGVVGAVLAIPVAATAQITFRALRTPAGALPSGPRAGASEDPGSAAEALTPRGGRSRWIVCARRGFHYLVGEPLLVGGVGLAGRVG
jgi:hypothetical protein